MKLFELFSKDPYIERFDEVTVTPASQWVAVQPPNPCPYRKCNVTIMVGDGAAAGADVGVRGMNSETERCIHVAGGQVTLPVMTDETGGFKVYTNEPANTKFIVVSYE